MFSGESCRASSVGHPEWRLARGTERRGLAATLPRVPLPVGGFVCRFASSLSGIGLTTKGRLADEAPFHRPGCGVQGGQSSPSGPRTFPERHFFLGTGDLPTTRVSFV